MKKRAHTILGIVPTSITISLPRIGYQEHPGQQSNYKRSQDHFTSKPGPGKMTPRIGVQPGPQCGRKTLKISTAGAAQPQLASESISSIKNGNLSDLGWPSFAHQNLLPMPTMIGRRDSRIWNPTWYAPNGKINSGASDNESITIGISSIRIQHRVEKGRGSIYGTGPKAEQKSNCWRSQITSHSSSDSDSPMNMSR